MSNFLSILLMSYPVISANNRGESEGNKQTIHKITSPSGHTLSMLSGETIRNAMRKCLYDQGLRMWRVSVPPTPENPVGYEYGENKSKTMIGAIPVTPEGYDDACFGWLVTNKDSDDNSLRRPSSIGVSVATSGSSYNGDMAFHLGLKPKPSKNGLPSYAPFSREQHWTRYQFLITLDLDVIKGPVLKGLLTSLLGLQVGGGHSASLMELSPCMMAWRFHKVRGQSGLYFGLGVSFPPDKPVDLAPLKERERTLGIKFQYAGSESEMSIRDGIDAMLAEAT